MFFLDVNAQGLPIPWWLMMRKMGLPMWLSSPFQGRDCCRAWKRHHTLCWLSSDAYVLADLLKSRFSTLVTGTSPHIKGLSQLLNCCQEGEILSVAPLIKGTPQNNATDSKVGRAPLTWLNTEAEFGSGCDWRRRLLGGWWCWGHREASFTSNDIDHLALWSLRPQRTYLY